MDDIGNALTVVVLRLDPDKANSTTWLLQALTAVDTFYLATCLVIQPVKALHETTAGGVLPPTFFPSLERHAWPLAAVTQTATVWIVLLVTTDRYLAVCRPFQARWSIERIRAIVIGVCLLALLYNLPQWFEREVVWDVDSCSRQLVKIKKTPLATDRAYFLIYKTVCHFVFRTAGPLFTISLLNWHLVQSLRAVKQRRKRIAVPSSTAAGIPLKTHGSCRKRSIGGGGGGSGAGRGRENVTRMVVAVICVFIVCELPDVAVRVMGTLANDMVTGTGQEPNTDSTGSTTSGSDGLHLNAPTIQAFNSVANALLALNSAANFAVYCLVGKKFRRILRHQVFSCIPTCSIGTPRCCESTEAHDNGAEIRPCARLDGYSIVDNRVGSVPVQGDIVAASSSEQPLVETANVIQSVDLMLEVTMTSDNDDETASASTFMEHRPLQHHFHRRTQSTQALSDVATSLDCFNSFDSISRSVNHCAVVIIETALSDRSSAGKESFGCVGVIGGDLELTQIKLE